EVSVAYVTGIIAGLAIGEDLAWLPIWVLGIAAALIGIPASHQRYQRASVRDRQRLQLLGCAVAVVVEVGLGWLSLRILLGWPTNACPAVGALTILVPLALAGGALPSLTMRADRLVVRTISFIGLTGLVTAIYLLVVIGLGRPPTDEERGV